MARLEGRIGAELCSGSLCVKCVLAKLNARHTGKAWGGCDGRPSGLSGLLRRTERERAQFAGVPTDATDEQLTAIAGARREVRRP